MSEFPKSRLAFISDAGQPDIPQYLIVKDTEEEIVQAALAVYDSHYPEGGPISEDEKWSFWAGMGESPDWFDMMGYVHDREEIEHFFDGETFREPSPSFWSYDENLLPERRSKTEVLDFMRARKVVMVKAGTKEVQISPWKDGWVVRGWNPVLEDPSEAIGIAVELALVGQRENDSRPPSGNPSEG